VLRALVVVTALVAVPAAAASSGAPRPQQALKPVPTRTIVTGEIKTLGLARIAVGRVACTIPAALTVRAGRFVVSDPVRITCLNGTLRSVKYAPPLAAWQTTRPATAAGAPSVAAKPSGSGVVRTTWAFQVVTPTSEQAATTTARGTIMALSASGITVGQLSCSIHPLFYERISPLAHVGDLVTIKCQSGTGLLNFISNSP
jgi:hypothetical protein